MSDNTPITGELRKYEALLHDEGSAALARIGEFCDAIDAVHANLEREYESLRRELDRVLGEQEEAPTSIGSATITITPALDWSGIAADLRELAALCERTREEDE